MASIGSPLHAIALCLTISFLYADASNFLSLQSTRSIVDELTNSSTYDKWSRPYGLGGPTMVYVRIYVYFLVSVDAQNLQYTAQILQELRWKDERLMHNSSIIEGEDNLAELIWIPHLYLVNEVDSSVMGSEKEDVLVSIKSDGYVMHSFRLKATLLCLMNLSKFPFDSQQCPLVLESWSYNSSQLALKWEENSPILMDSGVRMAEYDLVDVGVSASVNTYSEETNISQEVANSKFSGNYSSLTVEFQIKRKVGHYIMDYYVPSFLLVVVSWVSFWLDPNAVPGRITLGTSTMLTFITLSRNIASTLPKVSYIKATEYWFLICTGFIFGSLVEFAFVNTIWRRRKNVEVKKKTTKNILKSTLTPTQRRRDIFALDRSQSCNSMNDAGSTASFNLQFKNHSSISLSVNSINKNPNPKTEVDEDDRPNPQQKGFLTMTPQEIATYIDRKSRAVFPIFFLICNMIYWLVVLI